MTEQMTTLELIRDDPSTQNDRKSGWLSQITREGWNGA